MSALKVGVVSIIVGAIGCIAIYVTPSWFPVAAAVQAHRQDDLYLALMYMSSFIMAVVTVNGEPRPAFSLVRELMRLCEIATEELRAR